VQTSHTLVVSGFALQINVFALFSPRTPNRENHLGFFEKFDVVSSVEHVKRTKAQFTRGRSSKITPRASLANPTETANLESNVYFTLGKQKGGKEVGS